MTQTNDTPTRLDRIEAILETNSQQIAENSSTIHRIEQTLSLVVDRVNENTEQLTITMQSVDRLANIQIEAFRAIAEMQSEVRGLQTENRRILDVLQNRNGGT